MVLDVEVTSSLSPDGRRMSIINDSGYSTSDLSADPAIREIAAVMSRWVDNARAAARKTSMFDRGMFTPPENPYDEMRAARNAVKYDSVVAGVAETTEAYAFQGAKWESANPDESDVFNQLAIDQNLDGVLRGMWREEYTYGQFVAGKMWGWKEYTVRGATNKGNKRKKTYRIWAPLRIKLLDSTKIVPVGVGPLAGERLAWQATTAEIGYYSRAYTGEIVDPLMLSFFDGTYQAGRDEASELAGLGVDHTRLLALNPEFVFRHTVTKPDYERFGDIRLKSCFQLLDLKRQLMASDRATLVGSANYILLIKKGDKDRPAQPEELQNLKENYNFIAKMPVIISDDRLEIEIIAPKTDLSLNSEKYEVLNSQLLMRLLGTLTVGGRGQRNETQETLANAVAKVMENRRHMLRRVLELEVARAVVQHPKNEGIFETEPNLVYTPRNLALSLDQSYVQALVSLRTQREISRETILEFFGLDQETEALRLDIEKDRFDDTFATLALPGAAPAAPQDPNSGDGGATKDGANTDPASTPASGQPSTGRKKTTPNGTGEAPGVSGARGGRPRGGGKTPDTPAGQAKPRTRNGNSSTKD